MARRTLYLPALIVAAVLMACAGALLLAVSSEGEATSPGKNGRIAYASWDGRDTEIYTIKVGGGGKTNVTNNNTNDFTPAYSPDGKKIAYTVYNDSQGDIYTINAFGGGKTQVTNTDNADENVPSWGSRP
jgi:Tol biopolymer transport system component